MPLSDLQIAVLVARYIRERDRFEKMAATVSRHLSGQLRELRIPHVPTFRSKEPDSLRGKLARDRDEHEFVGFEQEFAPSVLDLAGVRILLYRPRDIDPTCKLIADLFDVGTDARCRRDHAKPGGYTANHRVVTLRDTMREADPFANLNGVVCELQVVTIGQHVWNELEHDIKYKTPSGVPTEEQKSLLTSLHSQLATVGGTVELLMDATERQKAETLAPIESADDLRVALKRRSGRPLQGNFSRLLDLLAGALQDVTVAALGRLPLDQADLDAAERLLLGPVALAGPDVDGVNTVIAALWKDFGADFVDIVGTWAGRPGSVARTVRALDEASQKGKL